MDGFDSVAIEKFLRGLAKAVHQCRVYPAGSPFIADALGAAREALARLSGSDVLELAVSERDLILDERRYGSGTAIERDLVRPLRRASVIAVRIHLDADLDDLRQFTEALVDVYLSDSPDLAPILAARGIERIEIDVATNLTIVEVANSAALEAAALRRERERRALLDSGRTSRRPLYPPGRCWIRVDPSVAAADVSLQELALLIGDPVRLSEVLLRLSGETPDPSDPGTTLERRFGDLAGLFASLDPHAGRILFGRLADAVLNLPEESRARLLKQTVLPALFDGRPAAAILRDFPDVELAEALCLLLDLETAAPEVLSIGLAKLNLSEQRHDDLLPLLTERLRKREALHDPADPQRSPLDAYAQRLVRVEAEPGNLRDFAAFDVSLNASAVAALEQLRASVYETDWVAEQLRCLCTLVRLDPRPEEVDSFLTSISILLASLEHRERHDAIARCLGTLRRTLASLASRRSSIARSIEAALERYCTRARAAWIVSTYQHGGDAALVSEYVEALGPPLAQPLIALLEDRTRGSNLPLLPDLLNTYAARLAPGLVQQLGNVNASTARSIIRALGHAGTGYEAIVADQLDHPDTAVGRDALHTLVRMGTAQAAALVAGHLADSRGWVRQAAAEALPRFDPSVAAEQLRSVLNRGDFVNSRPEIVLQLLKRVPAHAVVPLRAELQRLVRLRRKFWRPGLRRVASRAQELLAS